jgi:hypothetical protein
LFLQHFPPAAFLPCQCQTEASLLEETTIEIKPLKGEIVVVCLYRAAPAFVAYRAVFGFPPTVRTPTSETKHGAPNREKHFIVTSGAAKPMAGEAEPASQESQV